MIKVQLLHRQPQQQRQSSHDITSTPATKGRMPAGIMKKERQRRRAIMAENSKQKAFAAVLAATFLSDMYSGQYQTTTTPPWYSKQYSHRHSKLPIDSTLSFDMNERRSLEDRNACSFRTKLAEEVEADFSDDTSDFATPTSTYDDLSIGGGGADIKFDDPDCVSIHRSPCIRGGFPNISAVPADLISPETTEGNGPQDSMIIEPISLPAKFSLSSAKRGGGIVATVQLLPDNKSTSQQEIAFQDADLSEQITMPFSVNPAREPRCRNSLLSVHADEDALSDDEEEDIIGDDMSIITDISMIPTYCPSDVMRQQQKIRAHTLLARLIKSKTIAAKKTVRQLKRSCRGVVESTFSEAGSYRPTKCVRVGEAF
ncbi:hypothetical protein QBC43DRAFT_287576 [Cladorrhinum sp. PSN259]|nr:hypothetical protein QBC43DRAFT_287576 [Cladorrhinum sp. PSN259]